MIKSFADLRIFTNLRHSITLLSNLKKNQELNRRIRTSVLLSSRSNYQIDSIDALKIIFLNNPSHKSTNSPSPGTKKARKRNLAKNRKKKKKEIYRKNRNWKSAAGNRLRGPQKFRGKFRGLSVGKEGRNRGIKMKKKREERGAAGGKGVAKGKTRSRLPDGVQPGPRIKRAQVN